MALLDTHVVLWWATGDSRMSARATREIARAEQVYVSPVSGWEIATLVRKGRIRLDRDPFVWMDQLLEREHVELAPLTPAAAVRAGLLPDEFPGDPADRLLYATARDIVAPLVTKDGRLRRYARTARDVRVIW